MLTFSTEKFWIGLVLGIFVLAPASFASGPVESPEVVVESSSDLGVIRGMVRDQSGGPIADATVAIFRIGSSKVLKQVTSAADGSFLARIMPGKYSVLAVAEGFNPVTLAAVEVNRASQLNYGFKLQRAGSGNTLPEKRIDRNNPKWSIRASQLSRGVFQHSEDADAVAVSEEAPAAEDRSSTERASRPRAVVETYFASTDHGAYSAVNLATVLPLKGDAQLVLAGQTGVGRNVPQRFETQLNFRPASKHQVRLKGSFADIGSLDLGDNRQKGLSQMALQAMDEWTVREGVIVVLGVDYSRLIGAGGDAFISPRLGFQTDLDPRTRFRTAYTTQTDSRSWDNAIQLENAEVVFRDPVAMDDIVVDNGKPRLNRSSRFEVGIERVLDNNSSVEANFFFDTVYTNGVGMTASMFDGSGASAVGSDDFTADQQGGAQGLRLVYNRRFNGNFSAAAGYSVGTGQQLSPDGIMSRSSLFRTALFQTVYGQFAADLDSGTSVRTIFRFSPDATVFAIDPFQGRLAIYDPSLSVLITQNLPTLGLPIRAEAIVDARNLLGFKTGVSSENGSLSLNSQRRAVRGGIKLWF